MMKLKLLRYERAGGLVKSRLWVDGALLGEAREVAGRNGSVTASRLVPGTYACRIFASHLSPMTLKVCRGKGQSLVMLGYDLFRPAVGAAICLGQVDSALPPEEQELCRQRETFDALTQRLYEHYGEEMVMEVEEEWE